MTVQEHRVMDLAAAILNVFREDDSVLVRQVALGVVATTLQLSSADEDDDDEGDECVECGAVHAVCH